MPPNRRIPYTKPALTISQQIDQLRGRGMIISDQEHAIHTLKHTNYYRFGAYWLPFEENHGTHTFKKNTHFKDVENYYLFDQSLRQSLWKAITLIEISFRGIYAYHLGYAYGSHAHLKPELFGYGKKAHSYWEQDLLNLEREISRSNEKFIKHNTSKYEEQLPPIWVVTEVMSFGSLSKWYASLKPESLRKKIAKEYMLQHEVLKSWLQHLNMIRNICAHHGRLWNKEFTITPKKPKHFPTWHEGNRRIYNTLNIIDHFLITIEPDNQWFESVLELIDNHEIPRHLMGFQPGVN